MRATETVLERELSRNVQTDTGPREHGHHTVQYDAGGAVVCAGECCHNQWTGARGVLGTFDEGKGD